MLWVTLGYLFFVLSSKGVHGLPEEVSAGLRALRDNQESATLTRFRAHVPIYDIIFDSTFKYLYDSEYESSDNLINVISTAEKVLNVNAVFETISEIIVSGNITAFDDLIKIDSVSSVGNSTAMFVEASEDDKIALFNIVDEIPFSLNKSCDGLNSTKNAIRIYVDVIYLSIAFILDLTFNAVYPANQVALELILSVAANIFDSMIEQIYDLFRTCSNTTNADLISLIDDNEMQSKTYLGEAGVAILNACLWYISYVASGNKNPDLIAHVKECESETFDALREEMNHECLVREVFYLESHPYINTSQVVVSYLAANQNATIVNIQSNREAIKTICNEILYQVERMESEIAYDSEQVVSRFDIARAKVAENLIYGNDLFMELILLLQPDSSSNVEEARKTLNDTLINVTAIYFEMIEVALEESETLSNVTASISSMRSEAVELYQNIIDVSMSLIWNDENSSDEIETEFVDLKNAAYNGVADLVQSIENAVLILAELVHNSETSSTDYTTAIESIKEAEEKGISAAYNQTDSLSQACLLFIVKY